MSYSPTQVESNRHHC